MRRYDQPVHYAVQVQNPHKFPLEKYLFCILVNRYIQEKETVRVFRGFQVRFMKTGNVFWVDLSSQVHNLSFVLLFKEMSRDDGPR